MNTGFKKRGLFEKSLFDLNKKSGIMQLICCYDLIVLMFFRKKVIHYINGGLFYERQISKRPNGSSQ